MRAYVLGYSSATYVKLRHEKNAQNAENATLAAYLLRLWAAVVVLALLEATLATLFFSDAPRDLSRGPAAAAYVAANLFVFFAALLVLAHLFGRTVAYAPPDAPNTRAELKHLFLHLILLAYLRTTCWFDGRAAVRWLTRV